MSTPAVQQWLRSVLGPYANKDRVHADVDQTLKTFNALNPSTTTYIHDNGESQLLLRLAGTIAVSFRGANYNIPLAFWIPYDYPQKPPIAYVTPTSAMLVRANKNVEVSGLCRGEYLEQWSRKSEGCNLLNLALSLRDLFSKEPPVYAKPPPAANQQPSRTSPSPSPVTPVVESPRPMSAQAGPRPAPLPPGTNSGSQQSMSGQPQLPARPPGYSSHHRTGSSSSSQFGRPPFAPGPEGYSPARATRSPAPVPQQNSYNAQSPSSYWQPGQNQDYRPLQHQQRPSQDYHTPPTSSPAPRSPPPHPQQQYHPQQQQQYRPYQPPSNQSGPSRLATQGAPEALTKSFAAVNILDEDEIPSPTTQPVPSRPDNPDLQQAKQALHAKLQAAYESHMAQHANDCASLQSLQQDLLKGEPAILDEMARLGAVKDVCVGVREKYAHVVDAAQRNVGELRNRPDPEVDEIVCSTSVVYNQLIDLVAEDNALEDTIYQLGRGLNSGTAKIDLDRFLKRLRSLAREQFLKRALVNKILLQVALLGPTDVDTSWAAQRHSERQYAQ